MTALQAGANLIDLDFMGVPGTIASYVFDTGAGLALVDTGPSSTLPALEAGLEGLGASVSDVRHILLTHIHLDHAGAAGTLAERLPAARIYVHERGARHLASPEKLIASAGLIYGEMMERLWGEMKPVPPERLTVLTGGETLPFGGVTAHYTPGHAVHHLAYQAGNDLYVGDVGGVRLSQAQGTRAPTPPPDIDLEAWGRSIALLRRLDARRLHLAHFGSYDHEAAHWDALERNMSLDAGRVGERLAQGQDAQTITRAFAAELDADLRTEGEGLAERFALSCPPWMSVQGLLRYFARREARP